jgi:hypothetical protein
MFITDAVFEKLTDEELKLYKDYQEKSSGIDGAGLIYKYPDRVRYCTELFPGNYLDEKQLRNTEELRALCDDFKKLLDDTDTGEREILNFIKERRAYHFIGSIQKSNYNFGHHGTFVFPEFPLGTTYQVDYLMIGTNSDGYHFVFIEFESPYGKIVIGDGDEGEVIRRGLNQVDDWDHWIGENYASITETLSKHKHPELDLAEEFYKLDKTRLKYVVVAGRRTDFNKKLRRKRRKLEEDKKILLRHYDSLIDGAIKAIGEATY